MSSTRTAWKPRSSNSARPASSRLRNVCRPCARSSRSWAGLPPSDARRGRPAALPRGAGAPAGVLVSPGAAPGPASRPMTDQSNVPAAARPGLTPHPPLWHDAAPVMVDNAMGRLWWRRTPHPVAVSSPARGARTVYAALAVVAAGSLLHYIPGPPRGDVSYGPAKTTAAFRQIVLPDLAVVQGSGISDGSLARLRAIRGVGDFVALDGAAVTSGGA